MKELNPNWVHLRDELSLLNGDLLHEIRRRAPQGQQGQLDQLQGLVLNEHEIVSFLSSDIGAHMVRDEQSSEQSVREINLRAVSQLNQITQLFRLSRIEERCLVLCLAAEIDANYSKYTPNAGAADLKRAILDRYRADYGVEYSEAEVIVTAGGKQALNNAALALFGPGDEVITHAPY